MGINESQLTMLHLIVLSWVLWTKQPIHCDAICSEIDACTANNNKYSLTDTSYVPEYRRLKRTSPESHLDDKVLAGVESAVESSTEGSDVISTERSAKSPPMPDEDAGPYGDLNVTIETLRAFGRSMMGARHGDDDDDDDDDDHDEDDDNDHDDDSDDEEHGHGHRHNETEAGACNNVEHSWNEFCYFITKKPVPGYRSGTECSRTFPDAEFAKIESDEENHMVSEYIRELDHTSRGPLHLRMLYVYIKDDREDNVNRSKRFNAREEEFKRSICDLIGCPCTALRTTTGTWHTRICDTRHYALCRRPHHHPELEASTELVTGGVFGEEESSTAARRAAAPSAMTLLVLGTAARRLPSAR